MDTIAVLLSTYNGEAYLKEQIESILTQKDVFVRLIIRDDGSSDRTDAIISEYAKSYPNITFLKEGNMGCEKSFEYLYRYAFGNCNADYYAYADQDDVWFLEKLKKSVDAISSERQPALFCCNQVITDGDLNPLKLMIEESAFNHIDEVQRINYLKNRHGCTMVWNHALMEILGKSVHNEVYTPGHDKWLMLLARCAGIVVSSKEPLQYYRVHGNNTSGYAMGFVSRLKKGIKYYWLNDQHNNLYVEDCFSSVPNISYSSDGIRYLMNVKDYRKNVLKRIKVAFSRQIWLEGVAEGVIHSIAVLIGKY